MGSRELKAESGFVGVSLCLLENLRTLRRGNGNMEAFERHALPAPTPRLLKNETLPVVEGGHVSDQELIPVVLGPNNFIFS